MLHGFRPGFSYWLLVCLLTVIVTLTSINPAAAAAGNSWRGRETYVINYGSFAKIDRPNPNTSPVASYMLVISHVYVGSGSWLIQSGLGKTNYPGCPQDNNFYAFAEFIGKNTGGYVGSCFPTHTVDGQNSAYQETNNLSNPYWCAGINSQPCLLSATEANLGMTNATNVAAYGETTHTEAIMGNKAPGVAYLRQVSYKATRTGAINNPITAGYTNDYQRCNVVTPCPYNYVFGDNNISGTNFLYVGVQTP